MRILIAAAVLLMGLAPAAHGQALLIILFGDKLSTETFQLGINGDLTFSNLRGLDPSGAARISWAFGAYGEIRLSKHWRLQPEITLKTPAGVNNVPATPQVPGVDSVLSETVVDYSANYITIPLILKYQVDRVGLGFGGQIGFLTSANDRFRGVVDSLRGVTLEANIKDQVNTMDAGLVFSIDYAFRPELEMRSLRLNAKLYLGMMDIVDGNTGDALRNTILFVGLDIPVGGSKAAEGVDEG